MVDATIPQSRASDHARTRADTQGLSTDLESSVEECIGARSKCQSSPNVGAISVHSALPRKAITVVPVSRLASFSHPSPSPRVAPPSPISPPPPPQNGSKYRLSPLAERDAGSAKSKAQPTTPVMAYRTHRHHGFSRQALLHTKWLWSLREEEYHKQDSARSETVSPRSETSDPPSNGSTKSKLASDCLRNMSVDCPEQPASEPPFTIFPRRGELAGLRDIYCVEADRCFAKVPIWTLAKVLWVHDMHILSMPKVPEDSTIQQSDDDDGFDESASEISFDATSIGFSDDSESTLVDSEADSEWESSSEEPTTKGNHVEQSSRATIQASTSRVRGDAEPGASLEWAKVVYLKPITTPHLPGAPKRSTSWQRRWEILLELSHTEKRPEKSPPTKTKPLPANDILKTAPIPKKPSPPTKRVSFTRGFLSGLKKANTIRDSRPSSFVVQDSFLDPSHPSAG